MGGRLGMDGAGAVEASLELGNLLAAAAGLSATDVVTTGHIWLALRAEYPGAWRRISPKDVEPLEYVLLNAGGARAVVGGVKVDGHVMVMLELAATFATLAQSARVEVVHVAVALAASRAAGGGSRLMTVVAKAFGGANLSDLDGAVTAFVRDGGPPIGIRVDTKLNVPRRTKKRYDRAWDRMFKMLDRRAWDRTLEATAEVRRFAAEWGDHWQAQATIGRTWLVEAETHGECEQFQEEITCLELATRYFERDPENADDLGRALFGLGVCLLHIGGSELALPYFRRARRFISAKDEDGKDQRSFVDSTLMTAELAELSAGRLEQLVEMIGNIPDVAYRRSATLFFVSQIFEQRMETQYPRAAGLLDRVAGEARQAEDVETAVRIAGLIGLCREGPSPVPDTVRKLIGWLSERAASLVPTDQATALVGLAICQHLDGHLDQAVVNSVRAVAIADCSDRDMQSTFLRRATSGIGAGIREAAFDTAIAYGDLRLLAELIETARSGGAAQPHEANPAVGEVTRTFLDGGVVFGPISPLTVNGISALSAWYPSDVPVGDSISLERIIESVSGQDSWWWATYWGVSNLYWVLRSPDGGFSGGSTPLTIELRTLVDSVVREVDPTSFVNASEMAARHGNRASWKYQEHLDELIAASTFRKDPAGELKSMQELGEALLPPLLVDQIRRRRHRAPLRLVTSGNFLPLLPIATLAIGRNDDVRLIEGAILITAPPAELVQQVLRTPVVAAASFPTALVAVDARGEFEDLHKCLPAAPIILTGRPDEAPAAAMVASLDRETLRSALAGIGAGSAATLFYSGHASHSASPGDFSSGIPLTGTDVLTAGELIASAGTPEAWQFPARVVLAACSSGGSTGAGRGEWLGLSAGLLLNGSRQIIATSWPTWDTLGTARFDRSIAEMMTMSPDPATDLRMIQLDQLERWRTLGATAGLDASPVCWAAYHVIGVR
jgi:tetratricopeptide (TPR) repeat protein